MTNRDQQILTWGGIVVALLFLAFGMRARAVTVVEGDTLMGPQLGGLPGITINRTDYQLGDIIIQRPAMDYPPRGSCGCQRGSTLTLTLDPVAPFVVPPLPRRDPFTPVIPQGPPPLPKIVVCKDANFGSKCLTFRSPVSNMSTTGLGLNDGISSIECVGEWEVFEHAYFQGRSMRVSGVITDLKPRGFNDIISSMRPVQ